MRIDPDTCRDPDLLAAEVRRLQALLDEIRSAADAADAEYREEIDRLRLTGAEREAVAASMIGCVNERTHATLRGLLERISGSDAGYGSSGRLPDRQ